MYWSPPHISKIYEAISAIADERIKQVDSTTFTCTSSSRGKAYTIIFDPSTMSITSNDNTAYFTQSVSYPMIAVLMLTGHLTYPSSLSHMLKGIKWKDLNQRFHNDYDQSIAYLISQLQSQGIDTKEFETIVQNIYFTASSLKLSKLENAQKPPKGY